MANHEDYLDALSAYGRNTDVEIPPVLDQYLNGVAKNGETLFQWPLLKPLIVGKMEQVIRELRQGLSSEIIPPRPNVENVRFDVMHTRIMEAVDRFNGAPFTIQRLCELLIDPKRHYKRSDKFMRGLEKNVLVVSTVDPFGRKVVSESQNKPLVNGIDINGSLFSTRDPHSSTPLPPVPGWVTSPIGFPRSQSTTFQDSSNVQRQTTQEPSQETEITTNGVSSGLVSSLYADQGDQPLSVHAEEVVEETIVTMDTNEVTNVNTDGGEGMADDEDEEMGGEDTNTSSSSSSSSSSEDLSNTDIGEHGIAAGGTKVSSSVEAAPQGRPWAVISDELREGQAMAVDATLEQNSSISNSELYKSLGSQECPEASLQSTVPAHSPPLLPKPDDTSQPSSTDHDPSSTPPVTALSWQTINTDNSSLSPDALASANSVTTSSPYDSTQNMSQTVIEERLSFDFVATSSTSSDSIKAAIGDQAIESMDGSPEFFCHNSDVELQSESNVSTVISETLSRADIIPQSMSESNGQETVDSLPKMNPDQIVCSNEAEASCIATPMMDFSCSNIVESNVECDSVTGLEKLVSSVEASSSSLSPLTSESESPVTQSSVSSLTPIVPDNQLDSDHGVPTQSSAPVTSPQREHSEQFVSETVELQSSSDINSCSAPLSPIEKSRLEESELLEVIIASSESEETSHVDSTADRTFEIEKNSDIHIEDTGDGEISVSQSELGDNEAEEKDRSPDSPPSKRTSSDSMGFEVSGDSFVKFAEDNKGGEPIMPNCEEPSNNADQEQTVRHDTMDQV